MTTTATVHIRRRIRRPIRRRAPPEQWRPDWAGGPYQTWARKFCYHNLWRVQSILGSYEDAVQECAMVFCRCAFQYRHSYINPKWFMALYKCAVYNQFNTLSAKDGNIRSTKSELASRVKGDALTSTYLPGVASSMGFDNCGPLLVELSRAGGRVKDLIHLLLDEDVRPGSDDGPDPLRELQEMLEGF
jgi:hypothetical protein